MAKQNFNACFNCKNRMINCHSTCELYLKEAEENKKRLEEERKQRQISSAIYESTVNRLRSIQNNRHLK